MYGLVAALCAVGVQCVHAQRAVPDTAWARLADRETYWYASMVEGSKPAPQPSRGWSVLESLIEFFSTTGGKVLLVVFMVLVVGYIVYRIVGAEGLFTRRKRLQKAVQDGEEISPEDLERGLWEERYRAAAEAGDYRQALRYGHLHLLQLLVRASLIQYRADRTNYDYAAQMAGTAHVPAFRELARAYEYAWYGAYPTDAQAFGRYDAALTGLQSKLV